MPEKDPYTWSWLSCFAGVFAAICGGAIAHREQLKHNRPFSMGAFIFDMFTSAFVGFLAWWVFRDVLQQPDALCACAAGFAGNLGASVFSIAKDLFARRLNINRPPEYNDEEKKAQ